MLSLEFQHKAQTSELSEQQLNLPVILAGYTGSGKDTVSHAAMARLESTDTRHSFHHSRSRFTDRPPRPSEVQGLHGHFVTPEEFDEHKKSGEFVYDYTKAAYGGVRYGFSRSKLLEELTSRHTFVVGGEIDTSIGLKEALDHLAADTRKRLNAVLVDLEDVRLVGQSLNHILHPVILFVNRPAEKIIEGIKNRAASEAEKKKRIAHIENTWEHYPQALAAANERVELIWNDDVETAAGQIIQFVESEVTRQIGEIFGSKAAKREIGDTIL